MADMNDSAVPIPTDDGQMSGVTVIEDPNANLIVNYIPNSMTDIQLRDLFSKYGTINSARIIKDKATQRSLGYGFVKFASAAEAANAINGLKGFKIDDKTLKVQVAVARPQNSDKNTNLYVAGLEPHTTKEELQAIFSAYGTVTDTKILYDRATNTSRGVGFVKYERSDEAETAIKALNNATLGGTKALTVRLAEDKNKNQPTALSAALAQRGALRYSPIGLYGQMPMAASYGQPYQHQAPLGMYGQQMAPQAAPTAQVSETFCLFVYNLPPETDESYMYQLFGPYGAIAQVKVMRDPNTHLCKGFGFINMVKLEDAQSSIAALNGAQIGNKTLQVSFKRDKSQ